MSALLRGSLIGLFFAGLLLALPAAAKAQWTSRYVYPPGYTLYFYGGGGYGFPAYSGFSNPGVYSYNYPGAYGYGSGRVYNFRVRPQPVPQRGYLVPPRGLMNFYRCR